MKRIFEQFRTVGKFINEMVVKLLLTLVYAIVILPYHIFMRNSKEDRWITFNKTYSQQDFMHMG